MQPKHSLEELQQVCTQVRRDVLRMVYAVNSGHPGGAFGCTEYFVALYYELMHYQPKPFSMDGVGEDVFILSNGHISPGWYSVMARCGYFPLQELSTFRKIDSRLQGHPATQEGLEGVRVATGSLGQGLSVAIGAALSKRLNGDDRYVYCLCGDGEIQEGQIWEAAQFAPFHKVDNLIAAIDLNFKQIDGDTREIMDTRELRAKWEAFHWEVLELEDGNDIQAVLATLAEAQRRTGQGKPVMILLHTVMGKGVDFMENDYQWHGKAPNKEQFERAIAQLPETIGDY
jgi:transketolase